MNRRHFLTSTALAGCALALPAAEPEKLRVAVVGHTGRGDYGHNVDTMWLTIPEAELVAVADADAKGLAAALKKLKLAEGFEDYKTMFAKVKPDIVAVGPRFVDQHRDICLAAIEAGARGIYMEKPFCRTPAEADEIVAASEKRGVKIGLAHRNRYHPVLPVVRQAIKDGAIGKVLELRARGKEDQRGGSLDLWVLGGHLLDLICYFGGQPVACSATVLQNGKPITKADVKDGPEGVGPLAGNEVHARYETASGITAFFDSIQGAGTKQGGFGLQIVGTLGIVDLRIDVEPLAHIMAGSPFQMAKEHRPWTPISSAGIGKPEPVENLSKKILDHQMGAIDLIASLKENRQPLCGARDGRTIVEMICAVFESQRQNGQRVAWPLKERGNALGLL